MKVVYLESTAPYPGAYAQRGLRCLSVCVDAYSGTTGYEAAIPADSELREPEKQKGVFPETTAFERYAVQYA